jgi:hypothetical protein
MNERLEELKTAIQCWRNHNIEDYWLSVGYLGAAVNRFGDHDLTCIQGRLWHLWNGQWREVQTGSDYWLFSVPGSFAWVRDMIEHVLPEAGEGHMLDVRYNEEYGYVEYLRVKAARRDAHNFTYEVRRFGTGAHPAFEE